MLMILIYSFELFIDHHRSVGPVSERARIHLNLYLAL